MHGFWGMCCYADAVEARLLGVADLTRNEDEFGFVKHAMEHVRLSLIRVYLQGVLEIHPHKEAALHDVRSMLDFARDSMSRMLHLTATCGNSKISFGIM